ncbi:hypothetical protein Tco_1206542 [Tanacetum coccineum]
MRQRSDYDCVIRYHSRKANLVTDALSMKDKEPIRPNDFLAKESYLKLGPMVRRQNVPCFKEVILVAEYVISTRKERPGTPLDPMAGYG